MKRKTYQVQYGGHKTGEISFTPKEIEKLISVCNTLEDEVFIKLEVAIGLRREDCAHVKVSNIDFNNNTLTFYERKKDVIRQVPLPPKLIRLLRQYVQTIPKSQVYLFKCGRSRYGGKTLYNKLQNLCTLSDVPKRPVHALRASCAKLHLSEGWRIEQVASLLNDLPSTIEQYYSCPSDAEIRELMEKSEVI